MLVGDEQQNDGAEQRQTDDRQDQLIPVGDIFFETQIPERRQDDDRRQRIDVKADREAFDPVVLDKVQQDQTGYEVQDLTYLNWSKIRNSSLK